MEWCILDSYSAPEGEDMWPARVHIVLNRWAPQNVGNLLIHWWVSKHTRCSIGLVVLSWRPRYTATSSTAGRTGLLRMTVKSDVTSCHFRCFQPAICMWNCAGVFPASNMFVKLCRCVSSQQYICETAEVCFQPAICMWNCAGVFPASNMYMKLRRCVSQCWGKQKLLRERSNKNVKIRVVTQYRPHRR